MLHGSFKVKLKTVPKCDLDLLHVLILTPDLQSIQNLLLLVRYTCSIRFARETKTDRKMDKYMNKMLDGWTERMDE